MSAASALAMAMLPCIKPPKVRTTIKPSKTVGQRNAKETDAQAHEAQ
jgi:hypothetical protein